MSESYRCPHCMTPMADGGLCPNCRLQSGTTKQAPLGFLRRGVSERDDDDSARSMGCAMLTTLFLLMGVKCQAQRIERDVTEIKKALNIPAELGKDETK